MLQEIKRAEVEAIWVPAHTGFESMIWQIGAKRATREEHINGCDVQKSQVRDEEEMTEALGPRE